MAGYRFCISFMVALTVAFAAAAQTVPGESAAQEPGKPNTPATPSAAITKVYALSEFGEDQNLCKWVAETIPLMIQPNSWANSGGNHSLSYYAPAKVVVVCHTPAVHAQIDEFIQGLKKAMPPRVMPGVMQAQFNPDAPRVGPLVSASQAYPIPMQHVAPKHLFHFIIRYEGEGIIDSNVTKFAAALAEAQRGGSSSSYRYPMNNHTPAPSVVPSGSFTPSGSPSPFGPAPTTSPRTMPPADPTPTFPGVPAPLPSVPAPPTLPPVPTLPQ